MIIEIPATRERVEAHLIEDEHGTSRSLSMTLGKAGRATYGVTAMLNLGWKIVDATSAELAVLKSVGITPDQTPRVGLENT